MKKSLSILLSLVMISATLFALPFTAKADIPASGSLSSNISYKFNSATGLITISGSGDMTDYADYSSPFYQSTEIKKAVFSNEITTVANNLFEGCSYLASVTLPRHAYKIGYGAFYDCDSLERVIIPDGVTSIGGWAFTYCDSLKTIYIPENVTTIGGNAFDSLNALDEVYYSSSSAKWTTLVSAMGNNNDALKNVTTMHYNSGFCGENALFAVNASSKVATVTGTGPIFDYQGYESPFNLHDEIVSITVGNGITRIGDYAFAQVKNLKSVTLPDSVKTIGEHAISNDFELTDVDLGKGVQTIETFGFLGDSSLTKLTFPNSLNEIGQEAFYSCKSLSSIKLGTGITTIGDSAFENTALKTVTIPKNVTSIGDYAFGFDYDGAKDNKVEGFKLIVECDKKTTAGETYAKKSGITYEMLHDFSNNAEFCRNGCKTANPNYVVPLEKFESKATAAQVEMFITTLPNDEDPAGANFSTLRAKQKKITKDSITVKWATNKNAKYYVVYGARCGLENKYKKLAKVTTNTYTHKKLKKNSYYKYIVVAFDKNNKLISAAKPLHIATDGGKKGNFDKVVTAAKKDKVTLAKKGKTFKLKAKSQKNKNNKKNVQVHRTIRYESSNNKIATVSNKGVIKAKKKGTCYVYAYSQNGMFKKVKVTVKK